MASIGGVPINEFTTEGYFSCAFPTLFPTGAGDFSGQRQNQVTIGNYLKHLTMYDDNRFTKHPRFRFFGLNTEMRWRALQTGRVYVKEHPGDAQLSLDELRDMVGREGQTFSNRVSTVSESTKTVIQKLACTSVLVIHCAVQYITMIHCAGVAPAQHSSSILLHYISQWLNNDRVRGECDIANIYKGGHTSQHQVTIYDYSTGTCTCMGAAS